MPKESRPPFGRRSDGPLNAVAVVCDDSGAVELAVADVTVRWNDEAAHVVFTCDRCGLPQEQPVGKPAAAALADAGAQVAMREVSRHDVAGQAHEPAAPASVESVDD